MCTGLQRCYTGAGRVLEQLGHQVDSFCRSAYTENLCKVINNSISISLYILLYDWAEKRGGRLGNVERVTSIKHTHTHTINRKTDRQETSTQTQTYWLSISIFYTENRYTICKRIFYIQRGRRREGFTWRR